jgi:hypothetical protein
VRRPASDFGSDVMSPPPDRFGQSAPRLLPHGSEPHPCCHSRRCNWRATVRVLACWSRSSHRNPRTSPWRKPKIAAISQRAGWRVVCAASSKGRTSSSVYGSMRGLGCLGVRARATGFRGIRPRLTASERAALSVHSERGSSWRAGEQHLAHAGEPDEPYCAGGGTARIVPRSRLALLLGHQHQTGQQDRREGKRRLLPDRRERPRCLPPRTCRRRTRTGSRRAWALRPAPSQARNAATAGIDEDGSWCSAMRWPPSLPEPTQRQETSLPQPPPRPRAVHPIGHEGGSADVGQPGPGATPGSQTPSVREYRGTTRLPKPSRSPGLDTRRTPVPRTCRTGLARDPAAGVQH